MATLTDKVVNLFGSPGRGANKPSSPSRSTSDSSESFALGDGLGAEVIADGNTAQSVAMPSPLGNSTGGNLSASPMRSVGNVVFSVDDAIALRKQGIKGPFVIISEPLYYMSHHLHRSAKDNIADVVCKFYSQEEISDAKQKISLYDDVLQVKLKARRNTNAKLKLEAEVGDILNALYDLDKKEIKTRFLSENMSRIPPCNPSEIDPYSNMLSINDLQADSKSMKDNLGSVKAHAISNSDKISELTAAIQEIKSLLANSAAQEINEVLAGNASPNGPVLQCTPSVNKASTVSPIAPIHSYSHKVMVGTAKGQAAPVTPAPASAPAIAPAPASPSGPADGIRGVSTAAASLPESAALKQQQQQQQQKQQQKLQQKQQQQLQKQQQQLKQQQ